MADPTTSPQTAETGRISFEVQRLRAQGGALELSGRWYGVRGRRFVRPTLTLELRSDGTERRALATLEHKPWAARDGELWTAAFPLDIDPEEVGQMELSVAPDITVLLRPSAVDGKASGSGKPGAAAGSGAARGARSPRVRSGGGRARPTIAGRLEDVERLRSRTEAVEAALGRERSRREAAERSLETERTEALELRSEVGRLRVELDLAGAARQELEAASVELEELRARARESDGELKSTRGRAEDTSRQLQEARSQAVEAERAVVAARTEAKRNERRLRDNRLRIQELQEELEATVQALERERATTDRLGQELADAESAVRRLAGQGRGSVQSRPRPEAVVPPSRSGDGSESPPGSSTEPAPTEHRLEPMSPRLRALNRLENSPPPWADRPVNPALRPRDSWIVRIAALLVVLAALAAVVLVFQGSI